MKNKYNDNNMLESQLEDMNEGEILCNDETENVELIPYQDNPLLPEPNKQSQKSKELIPYDPVRAYLREMKNYPILSQEEEYNLAVQYKEKNDLTAAYKLVTSNLWLVVKIARDYEKAAHNLLDLIQEGNIGLMEAVKNFDPYRGVRLPSYAVWWIKAYLVRYIIANWRMVKIGTTQAQRRLFFNLKKEKEKLEREGFSPTPKLLAEKLNVKESEVSEMEQRLDAPDVSVDAPLKSDSETPLLSVLPAESDSVEDIISESQTKYLLNKALADFVSTLNKKEEIIYKKRLLAEDKETLQDLSEQLSLSKERVRQIENRIKEKLKKFMLERFGESIENFDL